ncbi:MAG: FAD-dependent oxidoreductase [Pseudomonadota bacterium]|nr:FAD-dependent oxidoreductase [Pseudomonadota bacterium]
MTPLLLLLACEGPDGPGPGVKEDERDTGTPGIAATPDGATPQVDVLVIGAGAAGLSAALEAWRAGASVRVLEREEDFGGAANWAGGLMLFSGTPVQVDAGVADSPATLLAEWASFTGGDPVDPWVMSFATQNVPMVHDWLAELGVTWNGPGTDASSGPTPRVHEVEGGGPALVAAIEAPLDGGVIRYGAEALEIVRNRTGRVTGVRWKDRDDDVEHVTYARTLIVATGGFMHDLERVRAERPDLADRDLRYGSWPGADGNGLALVEALGGATENLGAVGLYAHGVPAPGDGHEELLGSVLSALPWFNNLGERFADESEANGFATGQARAEQPDGDAWALLDAPTAGTVVFDSTEPDGASLSFMELDAAGLVVHGADLAELAGALGVDPGTLATEVTAYNDYVLGRAETDAFRDSRDRTRTVMAPPYYALPIAITVAKGFGGVEVDLSGRVVDTAGAPIPGLYAAGELTGMAGGSLVGDYGFTGSLSAVVLGGRVAGGAAASEALGD